ncbi:hypothetical protein [Flavobacterium collinsii]|uniref:hypothetical protein n=1 Tax=Flavobacterium collinsii TaxID=1114861 RepID=UPI00249325AD|nr:hypothetical protein [Flavobacterium collinsii]
MEKRNRKTFGKINIVGLTNKQTKMKKLLSVILLGLCLSITGQTKKTGLFYENFGGVHLSQEKSEDVNGEVQIATMLLFQDIRFTAISNTKYIYLYNKSDVELFIADLESALSYSKSGEKSVVEYGDKIKYQIDADARNGRITLWSKNADGLTFVQPKKVVKLLDALKIIKNNYEKKPAE